VSRFSSRCIVRFAFARHFSHRSFFVRAVFAGIEKPMRFHLVSTIHVVRESLVLGLRKTNAVCGV
jgi:hypothetical protein